MTIEQSPSFKNIPPLSNKKIEVPKEFPKETFPKFPERTRERITGILGIDKNSTMEEILSTYRQKWETLAPENRASWKSIARDWEPTHDDAKLVELLFKRFGLPNDKNKRPDVNSY